MNSTKEKEIEQKIENLKKICKEKGMRVTPQRIEIFKEVAKSCEHPDAETIYDSVKHKMPNVSIDTIYRTLSSLEEMNMIFRVDNQLPKARFDADLRPHHHFICTKCNEVYDIFIEDNETIPIPKQAKTIGKISNLNLQIRGVCNKCLKDIE